MDGACKPRLRFAQEIPQGAEARRYICKNRAIRGLLSRALGHQQAFLPGVTHNIDPWRLVGLAAAFMVESCTAALLQLPEASICSYSIELDPTPQF
jgi:hypothetical protein